ncbi:MAG: Mrp/NBP35 family ATP-binding protein [Myxococcota bacterium]
MTGRSVWLAGLVQQTRIKDGELHFQLVLTPEHAEHDRLPLVEALVANLRGLGFKGEVRPKVVIRRHPAAPPEQPTVPVKGMDGPGLGPHGGPVVKGKLPGVTHVVAVASGKGGVGKSTISCNLAVALKRLGLRVGLLDADIYGPSLPVMMNTTSRPVVGPDKRAVPPRAYGVACMSIGMVVDPTEAMIWRGPMVMGAVRQLLQDTAWGELDVLLVDLPPGTGDAQLTLIQAVDLSGAVVVTTPQEVALADAVRGLRMFDKLNVPLLGVVENMAYYALPDGQKDYVFGRDGGKRVAMQHHTEVLAEVPLRSAIRASGDRGLPIALSQDEGAEVFLSLARRVAKKLELSGAAGVENDVS